MALREELKAANVKSVPCEMDRVQNRQGEPDVHESPREEVPDRFDPNLVPKSMIHYTFRGALIEEPQIVNSRGEPVNVLVRGQEYIYRYKVRFTNSAFKVRFGLMIKTISGVEVGGLMSHPYGDGIEYVEANVRLKQEFHFRCILLPGVYFMNCGVAGSINHEEVFLHRIIDATMFRVQHEENLIIAGLVDFSSTTHWSCTETRA
jgi:lipopolysaccharide transport system ATP-binding protein